MPPAKKDTHDSRCLGVAELLYPDLVPSQGRLGPSPIIRRPRSCRAPVPLGRPFMARRRKLYEGKAKVLYEGPEPGTLIQYFKDDATAFNNEKKGVITGKGVLNNRISEYLMTRLAEIGIPTHFMRRLNMREQLIREV
jgi:hypothetical protein